MTALTEQPQNSLHQPVVEASAVNSQSARVDNKPPRAKLVDIWNNGWAVVRARWYLRGATLLGNKVRIWGRPYIHNWGRMIVGDRVRVVSTVAATELVAMEGAVLEIGEGTFINYGTSIAARQLIRLGANCSIGTHVIIMDNNFHCLEPERRNEQPES